MRLWGIYKIPVDDSLVFNDPSDVINAVHETLSTSPDTTGVQIYIDRAKVQTVLGS